MKKGLKITLIFSVVFGIILLGIASMIGGLNRENWEKVNINLREASGMYKESIVVNETTSEDISEIEISAINKDIILTRSESNEIMVSYYSNYEKEFSYSVENGKLNLTQHWNKYFFFSIFSLIFQKSGENIITLSVPEKIYEKIKLSTTGGDLVIGNTNVKLLELKNISGVIKTNNISADNIIIKSVSGEIIEEYSTVTNDFMINNVSGRISLARSNIMHDLYIKNTSGKLELNSVIIKNKMQTEVISGKVTISACEFNEGIIKTTSGGIELSSVKFKNVNFSSVSGGVKIINPTVISANVSFKTSSISGNTYIDGQNKGKDYETLASEELQTIRSKTTSGSFKYNS